MNPVFFLDIGHRSKGSNPPDPGAQHQGRSEVTLATAYVERLATRLRARGYGVEIVPDGPYYSRHAWAIERARTVYAGRRGLYLQCHLNAGGGRYSLVRPDHRSKWGAQAARLLATSLDLGLPEVEGSRSDELYPSAAAAEAAGRSITNSGLRSWWTRGWECIDGIYASSTLAGCIIEPGFIDGPTHGPLWTPEGLDRLAAALETGCAQWAAASR